MPLPTFEDAQTAVHAETASPLELFIYDNAPSGVAEEQHFRRSLTNLIAHLTNARRPDDGELADDVWCESLWPDESRFTDEKLFELSRRGPIRLSCRAMIGGWATADLDIGSPPHGMRVSNVTRGQVRRLCASLNLPLKEPNNATT